MICLAASPGGQFCAFDAGHDGGHQWAVYRIAAQQKRHVFEGRATFVSEQYSDVRGLQFALDALNGQNVRVTVEVLD